MVSFDPSLTFNHTCLRVKDPKVSIEFYVKNFGLELLKKLDFPEKKFTLYILALNYPGNKGYNKNWAEREGVLELCHNYGSESDPNFKINNGNADPHRGFGHICFTVDNINACCDALESSGVSFKKKLTDGRQKDIAFVLDPDGYWVELINNKAIQPVEYKTEISTYKFNHTMIRVKDAKKSLDFYQNVLGMSLVDTLEFPAAKFTLYFLGYEFDDHSKGKHFSSRQSLLELTHNWGTEDDPDFSYHNGNDEPAGYGHIGVSVKDPASMCKQIEEEYPEVQWVAKYGSFFLNNIAFVKDPDNYWIEILPSNLMAETHDCPGCSGELKDENK
ncbi:lactoylglutathione lyase [Saccharomycopsis crataegensis]|uniref:Lactoylglutathione lyase n=1 Tax=Saccharomycopsis crataegensis TaxID=43959 RepID=A0AAV5QIX8_9ASCO|nr:lactoylglutathione lyase [Saccharomycopsis crataegensis]